ncbi:hypothetical protein MRB53_041387 [Persea americana]|nr:hypothetical protein MRB53_041387 [Persea americana]
MRQEVALNVASPEGTAARQDGSSCRLYSTSSFALEPCCVSALCTCLSGRWKSIPDCHLRAVSDSRHQGVDEGHVVIEIERVMLNQSANPDARTWQVSRDKLLASARARIELCEPANLFITAFSPPIWHRFGGSAQESRTRRLGEPVSSVA